MKILIITKMKPQAGTLAAIRAVGPEIEVNLAESLSAAEPWLETAEVVIAMKQDFPREAAARAKNLKWVHSIAVGVEGFIYPEMFERGIILTNPRSAADIPVAEHAFALLTAWTRGISHTVRLQNERKWERVPVNHMTGRTLGIIGLGSIGREIARKAKLAYRMRVVATRKHPAPEPYVDAVLPPEGLDALLAESDYIVVAAAATPETVGLLGEREFAKMKKSAYIVNIARGPIINEAALARALREGLIAGAGLDVFATEPLPADSELWKLDNLIISPHLAGLSHDLVDLRIGVFTENLKRYVRGEKLLTEVDKLVGY